MQPSINESSIRVHSWDEARAILNPKSEDHLHNVAGAFNRGIVRIMVICAIASIALGLVLSFYPDLGGTYPPLYYVGHVVSGLNFLLLTLVAIGAIRNSLESRRNLVGLDNNPRLKGLLLADIRNLQKAIQKNSEDLSQQNNELSELSQKFGRSSFNDDSSSALAEMSDLRKKIKKNGEDLLQKRAALALLYPI